MVFEWILSEKIFIESIFGNKLACVLIQNVSNYEKICSEQKQRNLKLSIIFQHVTQWKLYNCLIFFNCPNKKVIPQKLQPIPYLVIYSRGATLDI